MNAILPLIGCVSDDTARQSTLCLPQQVRNGGLRRGCYLGIVLDLFRGPRLSSRSGRRPAWSECAWCSYRGVFLCLRFAARLLAAPGSPPAIDGPQDFGPSEVALQKFLGRLGVTTTTRPSSPRKETTARCVIAIQWVWLPQTVAQRMCCGHAPTLMTRPQRPRTCKALALEYVAEQSNAVQKSRRSA